MHKLILAILIALSFTATQATAVDCEAQAVEKKLSGAAKTSFLKKCEAEVRGGTVNCIALADNKKLYGAARNSFIKKCEAYPQAAAAQARCEAKADEKKLYGAARESFVKKCVRDAGV